MNALNQHTKKQVILLMVFILLLSLLSGCSSQQNSMTIDGKTVTLNLESREIQADDQVYRYVTDETQIEIEYPNGMVFRRVYETEGTVDDWIKTSETVDATYLDKMGYLEPNVLINQVIRFSPDSDSDQKDSPSALGVFLVTLGILNVLFPKWFWNIQYGWRYKNTEPTDTAINIQRLGGIIAIIVGFILML
ncbi:MAG: hypothetical protein LCH34_13395 [Firmicutes bacterium]|nr:hypothetical protein [Bacillota bacterium]